MVNLSPAYTEHHTDSAKPKGTAYAVPFYMLFINPESHCR